jgi:hypothetical protein
MAELCKCGYVFVGKQSDSLACLASIERSLRTLKVIALWWVWLTVAGVLIWIISAIVRFASTQS